MKKYILLAIVSTSISLFAQINATTSDGKAVVLELNGTWRYVPITNHQPTTKTLKEQAKDSYDYAYKVLGKFHKEACEYSKDYMMKHGIVNTNSTLKEQGKMVYDFAYNTLGMFDREAKEYTQSFMDKNGYLHPNLSLEQKGKQIYDFAYNVLGKFDVDSKKYTQQYLENYNR